MKRKWIAASALFVALGGTAYAAGLNGEFKGFSVVNVELNGQKVATEVPAINVDGHTLIPLRFFSESLGAQVGWDEKTYTASVAAAKAEASTASGTNASNGTNADDSKQKLTLTISAEYRKIESLADDLKDVSEGIRLAAERITSRNDEAFAKKVKIQFIKQLEDRYFRLLDETSALQNKTSGQPIDLAPAFGQLGTLGKSIGAYKNAVDELSSYAESKRSAQFDNYMYFNLQGYDYAFEAAEQANAKAGEWEKEELGKGGANGTA